jgi:hypothetical protein
MVQPRQGSAGPGESDSIVAGQIELLRSLVRLAVERIERTNSDQRPTEERDAPSPHTDPTRGHG